MAACGGIGSEFPRLFQFFPLSEVQQKEETLPPPHPPPLTSFPAPSLPPSPILQLSLSSSMLGHHMLEDRARLCGNAHSRHSRDKDQLIRT